MRKAFSGSMGFAIAAGLGLLMAACDSANGPVTSTDIVGTWTYTEAHATGWRYDLENAKQDVDEDDSSWIGSSIEFKSDNTFSMASDFPQSGKWAVSGNTLSIIVTVFGFTDTTEYAVTLDGDKGTFVNHEVDEDGDITTTLKATRK